MTNTRPSLWTALIVSISIFDSVIGAPLLVDLPGINLNISARPSPSPSSLEAVNASSTSRRPGQASSSAPFSENVTTNATTSPVSTTASLVLAESAAFNESTTVFGASLNASAELLNTTSASSVIDLLNTTSAPEISSASISNVTGESISNASAMFPVNETTTVVGSANETLESTTLPIDRNQTAISVETSSAVGQFNLSTSAAIDNGSLSTSVFELSTSAAMFNISIGAENTSISVSAESSTRSSELNVTESTLFSTIESLLSTVISTIGNFTSNEFGNATTASTISGEFNASSVDVENATLETTLPSAIVETNGTMTTMLSTEFATGINGTEITLLSTIGNELSNTTATLEPSTARNASNETVTPIELANSTIGLGSTINGSLEATTMVSVSMEATTVNSSLEVSTLVSGPTETSTVNISVETNATMGLISGSTPASNINETTMSEMFTTSVLFELSSSERSVVNISSGQQVNASVFDCSNRDAGLYGNPLKKCDTKFYICVDNTVLAYEQPCPARLFFDDELKVCESWIHIPMCSGKPRPTPGSTLAPSNETLSTATPVVNCANRTDGNYPDPIGTIKPGCSNRFYVCIGEKTFEYRCPQNLIYDMETDQCERQERVFACTGKHFNETGSTMSPPATLPPVDFDCSARKDGYYTLNCSNTFFSCNGGRARQLQCPHGLVFDVDTLSCDIPSNTFVCTGTKRTTRLVTTTEIANVSTTPSPMDCSNAKDGIYPDPLSKCSHVFYFCAHNESFRGVCPANLFYDAGMKKCDLWLNVFDCSGLRPTSAPKTTPSPPPVFPAVDFDCSRLEDGNYANPKNKCSKFYYVCANMEAFQQDCAADLYYDADRNLCDSWMNIFACSGQTHRPSSTPSSNFTLGTTEKPAFDCSAKLDGAYSNPVNACSHIYYQCVSGITYDFECPADLYFDSGRDQCDIFDNVFACSGISPTPSRPSSSTSKVAPIESPIDCILLSDGDYPDPAKNCSNTFYSCAGGYSFKRLCPHNTVFDSERDQCDRPSSVFACSGTHHFTTPSGPSTKRTPRPEYPFDCTKRYDGNYPAGVCLQQFWSCVGGLTFPRQCLFGLVYDADFDNCDFPFLVPKCGGKRITSTSKPILTSRKPPVFDCAFRADGNYLDPQAKDNCSNVFYTCANGIASRLQCPNGLFYDSIMDSCDHRESVPACVGKTVGSTSTSISVTASITTVASTGMTSELNATKELTTSSVASNETTVLLSTEPSPASGNESTTTAGNGTLVSETPFPSNETTAATLIALNETTIVIGTEVSTESTIHGFNESSTLTTFNESTSEIPSATNETTTRAPLNETTIVGTTATGLSFNESSTLQATTLVLGNESTSETPLPQNVTGILNASETTAMITGSTANISLPLETTTTLLNASVEVSTMEPGLNGSTTSITAMENVTVSTSELTTAGGVNITENISSSTGNVTGIELSTATVIVQNSTLGSNASESTTSMPLVNASEIVTTSSMANATEVVNTTAPLNGSTELSNPENTTGVLNTTELSSLPSEISSSIFNATELSSMATLLPGSTSVVLLNASELVSQNATTITEAPLVNATSGSSTMPGSASANNASTIALTSELPVNVTLTSSTELINSTSQSIPTSIGILTTEALTTISPPAPSP